MKYVLILMLFGFDNPGISVEQFDTKAQCEAVGTAAIDRRNWTVTKGLNARSGGGRYKCVGIPVTEDTGG